MSAFHIKASDGTTIHGYLTSPASAKPGAPAPPLIVLPHGGPHGVRDFWGFHSEVQLLASEGFAVLQVNYRGSGGYGERYQEAGYRHWGDRVIEDIVDATRWAVKKGKADPRRICSYGGSFGAYAALQSAILAPDLFRCAVGNAGIYDLTLPAFNADKLKAKVFLIHGKLDHRAPIVHAEKMRDALTAVGRPPEWLVEPHEAHGFYDEGARERMYTRLIAFLKANTQ